MFGHFQGGGHKGRKVVRFHQAFVICLGVFLGQQERFRGHALFIYIGNVRARVQAVIPATAEDHPPAVGAPTVETVHIGGVGGLQGPFLPSFQIQHPEIGILVPDREIAIAVAGETKEASVWGNARERYAIPFGRCIVEAFQVVSKTQVLRVEGDAVQAVAHFPVLLGHLRHRLGAAEIQPLPVGGEGGKGLKAVFLLGEGAPGNLVIAYVVDHYVGGHVVDLDAVGVVVVEGLESLVDGEGDEVSGRMPVGIYQGANCRIRLGVQFLDGVSINEHGASEGRPHMEYALGRISARGGVAVHAVSSGKVVGEDGLLCIAGQIPLVDTHLLPSLISRRNKPVRNIGINLFLYINGKGPIGFPLAVLLHKHRHLHLILLQQFFPEALIQGEEALLAAESFPVHLQGAFLAPGVREIEGRYVAGNRHKTVVRLHGRKAVQGSRGLYVPGT